LTNGIEYEIPDGAQLKLVHQIVPVHFDRAWADLEDCRNLANGQSKTDPIQNGSFPRRDFPYPLIFEEKKWSML
jgi:hypothetical protein